MRTKPQPNAATYGIDIGKKVFHVVALDADGRPVQRVKFSRETLLRFLEAANTALIGMEACAGSQWLARKLTALVAAAGDGRQFRKARDMAAWLGLVPAEHSCGGKQTLLGISKRGNGYVRRLFIHGARSCVLHLHRETHALGRWLSALEERTHRNKAVVALANKLTRIAWAILTRPGDNYLRTKGAAA